MILLLLTRIMWALFPVVSQAHGPISLRGSTDKMKLVDELHKLEERHEHRLALERVLLQRQKGNEMKEEDDKLISVLKEELQREQIRFNMLLEALESEGLAIQQEDTSTENEVLWHKPSIDNNGADGEHEDEF